MFAKICEIFYSLQLEGAYIGYPASFVRFSGCNLDCVFCDTKYAFSEYKTMSIEQTESRISSFNCKRIIFTGGEPLLFKDFIKALIDKFNKKYEFFLETNGTIWIDFADKFKHIVVSPKFDSLNYEVLNKYSRQDNVEFKILVENSDAFKEIENFFENLKLKSATIQPIYYPNESLNAFLERSKNIIETFKRSKLANYDVRLIIQNHKILYGEQRGV